MATLRAANVELHTAAQTIAGSGSSISVTSSASRQRRADIARAKRELAEARLEELQADLELAAGSQAGSVGRRMDDVRSEVGSIRGPSRDESTDPLLLLHTDVAQEQQNTTRGDPTPNQFEVVFSLEREVPPSIYDVLPRRGAHIADD